MVNKKIIPRANNIGVSKRRDPPHIVPSHEKILIQVGTAMTIVAAMKYALVSTSIPTVNIW